MIIPETKLSKWSFVAAALGPENNGLEITIISIAEHTFIDEISLSALVSFLITSVNRDKIS